MSLSCWQHSSKCSLVHCQPSLLQGYTTVLGPGSCLPGVQGLSLTSYFPAGFIWIPGIIILQVLDFAFPLVECHQLNSSKDQQVLCCISHFSPFFILCELAGVRSVLLFMSLMKVSNSIGPSTNPWGTPLAAWLQLDFMPLIITFWTQLLSQFSIYITLHLSNL